MLHTAAYATALLSPSDAPRPLEPAIPIVQHDVLDHGFTLGLSKFAIPIPPLREEHFLAFHQEPQQPEQNEGQQINNAKKRAAAPALEKIAQRAALNDRDINAIVEFSTVDLDSRLQAITALKSARSDKQIANEIQSLILADEHPLSVAVGLNYLRHHFGDTGLATGVKVAGDLINSRTKHSDELYGGLQSWIARLRAENANQAEISATILPLGDAVLQKLREPLLDRGTVILLTNLLDATGYEVACPLSDFLGSGDPLYRARGAEMISALCQSNRDRFNGTEQLAKVIVLSSTDENSVVRQNCVRHLCKINPTRETNAALCKAVKDDSPDVRFSVLGASIAANQDRELARAFVTLLDDPSIMVRKQCLDWACFMYRPVELDDKIHLHTAFMQRIPKEPDPSVHKLMKRLLERDACAIEGKNEIMHALDRHETSPRPPRSWKPYALIGGVVLACGILVAILRRGSTRGRDEKRESAQDAPPPDERW